MRAERLFEVLGLVDDRLIEEAADARRAATPWRRWAPLAASLVLVIGVGSMSFGLMLRGCGSSGDTAAPEMAAPAEAPKSTEEEAACDTSGAAAAEAPEAAPMAPENDAGAGMAEGSAVPEPAEAPADAPADDAPAAVPGLEPLELGAGPVLTLSARGAEALEAERTLEVAIAADHAEITDRYLVTNSGSRDVEAEFSYPTAGNLASQEASELTLTADGGILSGEMSFTSARYAYGEDGYSIAEWDWAALSAHRGEAVSSLDLDQTVTLWELRDVDWDRTAGGNAALSVSFDKPAGTRVLYNGFSGRGARDGRDFCEDEVTLDPGARREIVFLGAAPESWTLESHDIADRTRPRADVTCRVSVRTLSLGDYLRTLTGSDLERDLLAELLALDLREPQSGDLRRLVHWNLRAGHIFESSFRLTIPAGGTVEITAAFRQWGCWGEAGDYAYEILCGDAGSLRLTAQTARVTTAPDVTCAENDLPLSTAAAMEPGRRYRFQVS